MKYQCEVCGATFPNEQECIMHERECRLHNEKLINITSELSALIGSATVQKISLGVEIPITEKDQVKKEFFVLDEVKFNAQRNRITIYVKPNENKDNKPAEGSKKKS